MVLQEITLYAYSVPLQEPVRTARDTLTCREGLLVAVTADNGKRGLGEAAPLPGFSFETLEEAVRLACRIGVAVKGKEPDGARQVLDPVTCALPSVYFAFSTALSSLAAQDAGLPLYRHWNLNAPETVPFCALLTGSTAAKRGRAREALHRGCRTLKLKVGTSGVEEEAALVREIADRLPLGSRLRLDANQCWTRDEALRFCEAIPADKIDFLEEPVRDYRDMPFVQEATGVPCAVDESLQCLGRHTYPGEVGGGQIGLHDLREVVEQAQVLVWKPSLCLPPRLLDIRLDRPVVLSGAYETGVGTAAILALAASIPGATEAVGVDTYSRLAQDILDVPLPLAGSGIALDQVDALSKSVDPASLKRVFHA